MDVPDQRPVLDGKIRQIQKDAMNLETPSDFSSANWSESEERQSCIEAKVRIWLHFASASFGI